MEIKPIVKQSYARIGDTIVTNEGHWDGISFDASLDFEDFEYEELYNPACLPQKDEFDYGRLREWFTKKPVYIQMTSEELYISHSQFTMVCNLEDVGVIKTTMVREASEGNNVSGVYFYGMVVYVKNKPLLELPVIFLYDVDKLLVCKWRALLSSAAREKRLRSQQANEHNVDAGKVRSNDGRAAFVAFKKDEVKTGAEVVPHATNYNSSRVVGGNNYAGEIIITEIREISLHQPLRFESHRENVCDQFSTRRWKVLKAVDSYSRGSIITEITEVPDKPPNFLLNKEKQITVYDRRPALPNKTGGDEIVTAEVAEHEIKQAEPFIVETDKPLKDKGSETVPPRVGWLRRLLCLLLPCVFSRV